MKGREIMTKRFGFTLAEVLITLGIIGVVAAMTIPTLMNSTGQAEFKTGFKKALSVLNQAVTMNVALNSTDFSGLTSGTASGSIYDLFSSRMNIVSTSNAAVTTMGGAFNTANNYTLYFNDGMAVTFPQSAGATSCNIPKLANCRIVVDVNGTKKPNTLSLATSNGTAAGIYDEFVLDFYNQRVDAHDDRAKYILYN